MGLDTVELVMAFEEDFHVLIPDEVAATLLTPRHVIDFVFQKRGTPGDLLPSPGTSSTPDEGLTRKQIAERVKRIIMNQLGLPPEAYGEDKRFIEDFGAD